MHIVYGFANLTGDLIHSEVALHLITPQRASLKLSSSSSITLFLLNFLFLLQSLWFHVILDFSTLIDKSALDIIFMQQNWINGMHVFHFLLYIFSVQSITSCVFLLACTEYVKESNVFYNAEYYNIGDELVRYSFTYFQRLQVLLGLKHGGNLWHRCQK